LSAKRPARTAESQTKTTELREQMLISSSPFLARRKVTPAPNDIKHGRALLRCRERIAGRLERETHPLTGLPPITDRFMKA